MDIKIVTLIKIKQSTLSILCAYKKENGKTISKKLSKKQVPVCKTYIENNKKPKAIIKTMRTPAWE